MNVVNIMEKRDRLQCDEKHILSEMEFTRKDMVAKLENRSAVVPSVLGHHCPTCGECEFSGDEGKRYSEIIEKLKKTDI